MSFAQGFEKIAWDLSGIARGVGTVGAKASKAGKAIADVPKKIVARGSAARMEGARKELSGKTNPVGSGLYNVQAKNMAAKGKAPTFGQAQKMQESAQAKTVARKSRMDQYKKDQTNANKGSWASRNPIKTFAGLAIAGRYAMGGSDEPKNQPPPQISYY